MSEKMFNTRIIHKHDTAENWEKATGFIPKIGELIVYDPDENFGYARTKMGDGITKVNDLPFANVQADWNQNNENAADFVKNRTHWAKQGHITWNGDGIDGLCFVTDDETVIQDVLNGFDFSAEGNGFLLRPLYRHSSDNYEIFSWHDNLEDIDTKYRIAVFIALQDNLTCDLVGVNDFTIKKRGIYFLKDGEYNEYITDFYYKTVEKKLDNEYLNIATDDEIIEMLGAENIDMLPAVTDADGAMLTDENDNILMW